MPKGKLLFIKKQIASFVRNECGIPYIQRESDGYHTEWTFGSDVHKASFFMGYFEGEAVLHITIINREFDDIFFTVHEDVSSESISIMLNDIAEFIFPCSIVDNTFEKIQKDIKIIESPEFI